MSLWVIEISNLQTNRWEPLTTVFHSRETAEDQLATWQACPSVGGIYEGAKVTRYDRYVPREATW